MSLNENRSLAAAFDAQITASAQASITSLLAGVESQVKTLYQNAVAAQFPDDPVVNGVIENISQQSHQIIHTGVVAALVTRMQDAFTARLQVATLIENEA